MLRIGSIALAMVAIAAGSVWAQRPGTTVQLPTYSYYSGGTTLSVPDRGSALMNGIKRASTGRNEFGVPMLPFRPFRNSAIGTERSAMSTHVTATIHDFEAMDRYLLSQPTRTGVRPLGQAGPGDLELTSRSQRSPRNVAQATRPAPSSAARPTMSVAAARAIHQRERAQRNQKAEKLFTLGRKAETAGKNATAKVYYRMATREATGPLQQQIVARLDTLSRPATVADVAQARR